MCSDRVDIIAFAAGDRDVLRRVMMQISRVSKGFSNGKDLISGSFGTAIEGSTVIPILAFNIAIRVVVFEI